MPSSRRRVALGIVVVVAVQAAAIGIYFAVERARATAPGPAFRVEKLAGDQHAADIVLERADGARVSLHDIEGRVRLVHFWATWCPPCVEELPGLLATSNDLAGDGLALVAISVDDDWTAIRAFFQGDVPAAVYRAVDGNAHARYDIVSLPDTYLIPRDGRLRVRYGGARDWQSAAARAHLVRQLR